MDFDLLKNEMGKIGNLDLELIERTSLSLLKDKAKDVRVMSFLSFALLRQDRFEELADLFCGLAQWAEKSFDALQPDRERAKQLAFKWLSEDRFTGSLVERKPAEADYNHIVRLTAALVTLKTVLEQKFPEASPFPADLYRNALQWEKACKPKPVAAAPTQAAASTSSGSNAPLEIMETPRQAQASARKAAAFLIEKEPQKPMGYRLMRSLRWDIIEKAPPAESLKTPIPPPPPQQRTFFENLLVQSDWKNAFEKGEAAFGSASNHLWLDLQRIISTAALQLGEPYAAVRFAILFETASFIKRVPAIVSLQFADATPFCDEATKAWLAGEVAAVFAAGSGSLAEGPSPGAADPFESEMQKVNQLVGSNQIEDAIDLVQNSIRTARSERESFRRSILVGSLLLKAKQAELAVFVLEMLDESATAHRLFAWEPDLAVEAWSSLVLAYKAVKVGKPPNIMQVLQDKQNSILSKVSSIDPIKAMLLNK